MNITLSPEQEKFIQSQLNKGKYSNTKEIIDQALQLLEKQEENYEKWLLETRKKVQIGIEQLEKGEKVDGEIVIKQLEDNLKLRRKAKMND